MNLRAKLKVKESIELENEKLKEELSDIRSKAAENEKKKNKYKDQIKELQLQNERLMKDNKGLKEEIGELIMDKK